MSLQGSIALLVVHWPQTSILQNSGGIHLCCSKPPSCGALLQKLMHVDTTFEGVSAHLYLSLTWHVQRNEVTENTFLHFCNVMIPKCTDPSLPLAHRPHAVQSHPLKDGINQIQCPYGGSNGPKDNHIQTWAWDPFVTMTVAHVGSYPVIFNSISGSLLDSQLCFALETGFLTSCTVHCLLNLPR